MVVSISFRTACSSLFSTHAATRDLVHVYPAIITALISQMTSSVQDDKYAFSGRAGVENGSWFVGKTRIDEIGDNTTLGSFFTSDSFVPPPKFKGGGGRGMNSIPFIFHSPHVEKLLRDKSGVIRR